MWILSPYASLDSLPERKVAKQTYTLLSAFRTKPRVVSDPSVPRSLLSCAPGRTRRIF